MECIQEGFLEKVISVPSSEDMSANSAESCLHLPRAPRAGRAGPAPGRAPPSGFPPSALGQGSPFLEPLAPSPFTLVCPEPQTGFIPSGR